MLRLCQYVFLDFDYANSITSPGWVRFINNSSGIIKYEWDLSNISALNTNEKIVIEGHFDLDHFDFSEFFSFLEYYIY